jgi:hypothetical protein
MRAGGGATVTDRALLLRAQMVAASRWATPGRDCRSCGVAKIPSEPAADRGFSRAGSASGEGERPAVFSKQVNALLAGAVDDLGGHVLGGVKVGGHPPNLLSGGIGGKSRPQSVTAVLPRLQGPAGAPTGRQAAMTRACLSRPCAATARGRALRRVIERRERGRCGTLRSWALRKLRMACGSRLSGAAPGGQGSRRYPCWR